MKFNIRNAWDATKHFIVHRSPEITTGIGVAGIFIGGVLTVIATCKACRKIDAVEKEQERELTKKEKVQETWKYYIPPVATFLTSAGLIIWSDSIYRKRNAALTMACSVAETQLSNYQEAVSDMFGTEREREVHEKANEETAKHISVDPTESNEYIISSEGIHCIETFNGRRFKIRKAQIEDAVNNLNLQMNNGDDEKTLNDVFFAIGLPTTDLGDIVGWNRGVQGLIQLDLNQSIMVDGIPRMVLDFYNRPSVDFDRR